MSPQRSVVPFESSGFPGAGGYRVQHVGAFPESSLGEMMQYLPGWTVQCINPECEARGQWLRVSTAGMELCANCGAPLHNVPPPLPPRFRMRPRPLGSYRPAGRPR